MKTMISSSIEVNARIQVEHPVSEMITGVDLIKAQIAVAANRATTDDSGRRLQCKGHSIECRINAENPDKKFSAQPWERSPNCTRLVVWGSGLIPMFMVGTTFPRIMIR